MILWKALLTDMGFKRWSSDHSLFFTTSAVGLVLVLVYVDDILVTGDDSTAVVGVIQLLKDKFKLRHLGDVNYFLGIEVKTAESSFVLYQQKYLHDLLHRTGMDKCHASPTPMAVNTRLSKYGGESFSNPFVYRSTVGALQYLTLTMPDIAFTVNKLSQFLHSPSVDH